MTTMTEAAPATTTASIPTFKPSSAIPTSLRESFRSWWSTNEQEAAISEERLLSRLPFFVSSSSLSSTSEPTGVRASVSKVELGSPKRFLNTLSIMPVKTPDPTRLEKYPPTVILPGYGAVDWLGMGRSARVPFSITAKRDDTAGRVTEAENFFTDALEEWRIKQGHEKMALVGHSLGAYLSTAYALRFPDRVSRLILLSPAGVPHDPDTMAVAEELTAPPPPNASLTSTPSSDSIRVAHQPTASEVKRQHNDVKTSQAKMSRMRRFGQWAWEEGWSPFQIVRSTLFWGPMLVGKYSARRFAHLPEEDLRDMHSYIWHITSAKGSGEYCISHILRPGAFARMPLVDRVASLKIPVTFAYGDHDWMDADGGRQAVAALRDAGNPDGRLFVIKDAGHHLYLDNPTATNDLLLAELKRPSTISKK